ncbi:31415_t:CDS:2, partial [Racocetra persica]
ETNNKDFNYKILNDDSGNVLDKDNVLSKADLLSERNFLSENDLLSKSNLSSENNLLNKGDLSSKDNILNKEDFNKEIVDEPLSSKEIPSITREFAPYFTTLAYIDLVDIIYHPQFKSEDIVKNIR